ncbi:ABC transporter ATP-binding protein [Paenibacillus sp. MBLB4367]|uniref:ABC transporter ATP-binding protein n=1 Tax=Paenibacillus sp. MBLB4367 TaxID=3384767 RepID=UPI00390816A8
MSETNMTQADPVVRINQLTKKIGGKTIVDNLTFDVPRGEVFGFLGPNGAGKTTTIRMMVGLIRMTHGVVMINGINVENHYEQAMNHVGAIVENPEMYKFLTGYQNLIHFSRMHPAIPAGRIDEVVELVGLKSRIHDKVKTYSLGMRQRLGVAQAILHKPSVLILDEPTNGLDPAGIRELRDYLRNLARTERISVIVSSHLLSEMELMCDRVAIIQSGKLIDVKPVRQLAQGSGEAKVLIEVDRPHEAMAALSRSMDVGFVGIADGQLELRIEREHIPQIASCLVTADFRIYGIRTVTKTLEETFLEMTGVGAIG